MSKTSSNRTEPTILLPNVEEHVDAACIMHELRNLGCISHVVVTKCLSMNGAIYSRASVHFKYWYENSSTVWPRTFLLEGKTISMRNDSYVWQAQALVEDSRSYKERRLDDALCDQDVAQGFNDRRKRARRDDVRSYTERRLDDALCEEDIAQGFIDRRNKHKRIDYMSLPISKIADALPEEPEEPKQAPLIRNSEFVARMSHAFRCEITDDIYRDNIQVLRDAMTFARELCEDDDAETKSRVHYDGHYPVIRRKMRTIVV